MTLNLKRLLGFNQLSAISKILEVHEDQTEDLRRLANKIGVPEAIEIIESLDIGRLLNKIGEQVSAE